MKFLSIDQLEIVTSFLSGREVGDRIIDGRLEAFSCKRAGEDKKLSKVLEQQYAEELASSPSSALGSSPLGPLSDSGTRRLLIDLISTMNASFPDHDFSALRPDQFCRELHLAQVMGSVNKQLAPLCEAHNPGFMDELWQAIDEVVRIHECEVYSYTPDMEDDPFSQFGSLWSFNYFFFNRGLKRIMYFTCIAKSRFTPQTPSGDGGFDEGDEVGDGYRPGDGGFGGGGFFGAMDEEPSDLNGDYEDEA